MTLHTSSIVVQHLLAVALQAAVLAVLIGAVVFVFRGQLAPRWRHRLWWIVVIRLAIPVLPTSPVSLYQWLPEPVTEQRPATAAQTPPVSASPQTQQHNAPTPTHDGAISAPLSPHLTMTGPPAIEPAPIETAHNTNSEPPVIAAADGREAVVAAQPPQATPTGNTPAKASTAWYWPTAFILWLGVAAALALRTLIGWLALWRRIRDDATNASDRANALLRQEARSLGIKPPPALRESPAVTGPTLLGVFRPILLMPPGLARSLDDQALRLIFRHEFYHLRARDNIANWLFAFLLAAHWFNPLAWWAIAQLRAQRELARDAQTVKGRPAENSGNTTQCNAQAYADALMAVVRFTVAKTSPPHRPSPVTSAAVRDRKHLARRLAMLEHANRFRLRHTLFACVLLTVLGVTSLTVAQDRTQEQTEDNQPAQQENVETQSTDQLTNGPEQPEDEAAQAARQLISALWKAVPFEQAITDLEQQTGLTITFDPTIQDTIDAVDPQPLISLLLARVPIEQALKLALEQLFDQRLHDALPPVGWRWTLEDGTLHLGLETTEIRVYNIHDLTTPHQRDMTQAPWTDEERETSRLELVAQLCELIHTTAGHPEHWTGSWVEAGYGGMITRHQGLFLIRTTPTNHRVILGLLSWLRAARGIQISYETQYFLLDNDTFIQVFSEDISIPQWRTDGFKSIHPSRLGNHAPNETQVGDHTIYHHAMSGVIGLTLITHDQQELLLDAVTANDGLNLQLMEGVPRVTAFNAHQVFVCYHQQLSYISSMSPNDHGEPEPTLSVTQTGMLATFMGTASADRAFVCTEIGFEAAAAIGPTLILPLPENQGGEHTGFTEVPQINRIEMQSTVHSPIDEWLLIVGPLIQGKVIGDDDPAEYTDTRRVVLLIKPTIIEMQEIEFEDAFPEGLPESE